MAWGSAVQGTQLALSTSLATVQQSAADWVLTLNPRERAQVQLKVDSTGTTDRAQVEIQASADGGTTWDTLPTIAWDSPTGDSTVTIVAEGVERFRIQAKKSGSTDTITLDAWVRKDGVSA